ncbi:hypothetical protein SLA_6728 [Streptomyces laurentii]|uniref:Uncharacterized protein n=1 Tax=Streptomyces laurentii TaxID=39478 RepID=A0A160P815_STRLU|nr:hypothetical protein SLA_6728 [Streptomyces laurentii]
MSSTEKLLKAGVLPNMGIPSVGASGDVPSGHTTGRAPGGHRHADTAGRPRPVTLGPEPEPEPESEPGRCPMVTGRGPTAQGAIGSRRLWSVSR